MFLFFKQDSFPKTNLYYLGDLYFILMHLFISKAFISYDTCIYYTFLCVI